MAANLYTWALLSMVVWIISTTIARARVFRPLRKWVKARSDYFGEGISCQYCISHWVGFIVTLIHRPVLLPTGIPLVDLGTSAFAIIGLGALIARTIGKTPPNGVPHPDEKAEQEAQAREELELRRMVREMRV